MRCEYCGYYDKYQKGFHRNNMTVEVMEKAIINFLKHSRHMDEVVIFFYGDEPLLQYEMLEHGVQYAKDNQYGQMITFTLTTNRLLLDEEKAKFLVENVGI